ncbi:MAG: DUF2071 domain-containing protein [Bacteroidota bacterium]
MNIPTITGTIDRRILINFQVEAEVLDRYLPAPFRPKLVEGKGIAGICLIRLKQVRPIWLPLKWGLSSENGAHRLAVEWTKEGQTKEGVYIPRRDTSSRLSSWAGGRIFPGVHHHAHFSVEEHDQTYHVAFQSQDHASLMIKAHETEQWNEQSVFDSVTCASDFLENGSVGYSPDHATQAFEGLELQTYTWKVKPLAVTELRSSFFENEAIFPKGSIQFDNALLMKNIEHEWRSLRGLKASEEALELQG